MQKCILYISPGPSYNAHSPLYQKQYELLSKTFKGYILTTSRRAEKFQIHNFTYVSMKSDYTIRSNFRFVLFCIHNAIKLSRNRVKIDLVTTYDPLKTGLIGLLTSRLLGAKFAPEVNGVYTSPAEWMDEPDILSTKLKQFAYPIIMRFVLKKADGIKLLFKHQIAPFKHRVRGKIIRHFPCFVPTDRFKNIEERKEILFVGFPFKRKGVDILINAYKKITPKYPDWQLKILGWFPDPTELNRAIGDHPQIYHHPPVHFPEMPNHIGTCAILVLPSRSEAMGRVLLEAMAAGKPRIGSDIDGIPNVINHGVDGLLFEPENIEDLANKLDLLMSNSALRKKLGRAGETRAKTEFTEEVYIKDIIDFYNEIIDSLSIK